MMLVGLVWAVFAPLLMFIPMAILAWGLGRIGAPRPRLGAAVLTLATVLGVYWADRVAFQAECAARTSIAITHKAVTDGVLLTSGTADSFGYSYLHSHGFTWMEIPDIYRRSAYVRLTRGAEGAIDRAQIDAPTARYEVIEKHESLPRGISFMTTRVIDRQTGVEMAHAGYGNFLAGRMSLVLGAWGTSSCEGLREGGMSGFTRYYNLAKLTLRPADAPANP